MKRSNIRMAVAAAVASAFLAGTATAQTVWGGVGTTGCTAAFMDMVGAGGELYAVKLSGTGANTMDWVYDLSSKGSGSVGGATLGSPALTVLGGNFTFDEAPTDSMFLLVTFPPEAGGEGARVIIDSSTPANPNLGPVAVQTVGETLPSGSLSGTGLEIMGDGSPLSIDLGTGAKDYPFGASGGVDVVMGALVDVNNDDMGGGCSWGGRVENPGTPGHGVIIGYNVYRMDDSGSAPAPADWSGTDWMYFIDLDGFVLTDANGMGTGDSPSDGNPTGDYAGIQDLNAVAYDGNEFVIFADTPIQSRAVAPGQASAAAGSSYWYAMQPVAVGMHSDFTSVSIARAAAADLTMDDHRIDLDADGSPEFFSPQAIAGLPGLGLTNGGMPLLSAPVLGSVNPAAAFGVVQLKGTTGRGGEVRLELSTTLEGANVAGYNVYRVTPRGREQVNTELITANGGEGSVYLIRDTGSRRAARGTLSYEVEVVQADGSAPSVQGPFVVTADRSSSRRR